MRNDVRLWMPPLLVVVVYPGLIASFAWAVKGYHQFGNPVFVVCALLTMLLAASVPLLAVRAMILIRHDERAVLERAILLVMVAVPSLFTLTHTLTRMVGRTRHYEALSAFWIAVWIAVGAVLYFRKERAPRQSHEIENKWLRVIHGVAALCLLCAFLIAHLINHDLAVWSVALHDAVMKELRLWYRTEWVELVLLGLFVVMVCTGFPMVARHARQRMDAFRVVQVATGVYVGAFICSHLFATLMARTRGIETDWFFAAGPASLLDGSLLSRLIPYYFYGALFLCLHVACGLRVVLLQHGVAEAAGNRVLYGLAGAGLVVTVLLSAALLGFHVQGAQ
jgi:hypothetical protein